MKRTQIRLGRRSGALGFGTLAVLLAVGCASPGPPKPPSLRLPDVITDLRADRIGEKVIFHWTNPTNTTDGLAIKGPTTAVLCRSELTAATAKKPEPCVSLQRLAAKPGAAEAVDTLDAAHQADPPRLLAYRVELFNAKNRSAGPSAPAYAAAGAVPPAVAGLRIEGRPRGLQLEWNAAAGASVVRVRRTLVSAPPAKPAPAPAAGFKPGRQSAPVEALLSTGATDAGGTLDTGVKLLQTYRYTAERVLAVNLAGHALELHSVPSAPVEYAVRDVFPPRPPAGLAVIPGFGDTASASLSWEPSLEEDLAGYLVYRRTGDDPAWVKLTPSPVEATSFEDKSARGTNLIYRVTAVDQTGNESKPGVEVRLTP